MYFNIRYSLIKMTCVCRNYFCYCAALLLQMQLRKIRKWSCTAFQKLICVWTQCSSEVAFRFFRKNCLIIERSLPIWAVLQTYFIKNFRMSTSFSFWRVPYMYQHIPLYINVLPNGNISNQKLSLLSNCVHFESLTLCSQKYRIHSIRCWSRLVATLELSPHPRMCWTK